MTINMMDKRRHQRCTLDDTVILTPRGVCQLKDISSGGLSFKCLNSQDLPAQLHIDILDTAGNHLQELEVEKVWEMATSDSSLSSVFALAVGVRFTNLTATQRQILHNLVNVHPLDTEQANYI